MKLIKALLCLGILLIPVLGVASTGYVSDQLVVSLRDQAGADYKVLKSLRTDSPVEVLAEEGRYLRVRTPDGVEGFVLRQYITSSAPKSQVIKELKGRNASLEARLEGLSNVDDELETERQKTLEFETNYRDLEREHRVLVESSGDLMAVIAERDRLKVELEGTAPELQRLAEENSQLLRSSGILWFLAGAGVLFVGWIAGKISRGGRSRRY